LAKRHLEAKCYGLFLDLGTYALGLKDLGLGLESSIDTGLEGPGLGVEV